MYIHDGQGENGTARADIWFYNPTTQTWTQGADMSVPLMDALAATFEVAGCSTHILLFGGTTDPYDPPSKRAFEYVPDVAEQPPAPAVTQPNGGEEIPGTCRTLIQVQATVL